MTIRIPLDTPNGLTSFHQVDQANLQGMNFKLRVNSYPTKEDADNKTGILWQTYPIVPLAAMGPEGLPSLERYLTEQDTGDFAGGEFIPYPPPPEPVDPGDGEAEDPEKIGRASCRERV